MPDFKVNASDPFSNQDWIIFDCEWADTRAHAPVFIIPHLGEIYFRYHDRYWDMTKGILLQIMGRNNILAMQIRRGDMLNMTSPTVASFELSSISRRLDELIVGEVMFSPSTASRSG